MQYARFITVMLALSHFCHMTYAKESPEFTIHKRRNSGNYTAQLKNMSEENKDTLAKEHEKLEQRIRTLELQLSSDERNFVRGRAQAKSVILEKIEQFLSELREIRQDFFSKLGEIREEVKSHTGDIAEYKEKFDALSDMLGNPEILETISGGAEKLFAIVVVLSDRIAAIECLVQELRDSQHEASQTEAPVEKCAVCVEVQEENEKNRALVRMLEEQMQQQQEAINHLMELELRLKDRDTEDK